MARDADIVVVGAGVVGAATARALAGTFGTVVLLERFALGHAHGSSHGTSRIFRLNYPDERYVRMAQASGHAWRELERERDVQLLVRSDAFGSRCRAEAADVAHLLGRGRGHAEIDQLIQVLTPQPARPRFAHVEEPARK